MSDSQSTCQHCAQRERLGMPGPCAACAHARATRPTPPIVKPDNKSGALSGISWLDPLPTQSAPHPTSYPTNRLVLKLTLSTTLDGAEYDRLSEDQIGVMVEELEKTMRKHLNYVARSAEFAYVHLGISVKVDKEI